MTGQTLLTILAVVLLAIVTLNINRIYVKSVDNTVDAQIAADALNLGRDLSERVQSYAFRYTELVPELGNKNNVNNQGQRETFTSTVGHTLHSTYDISAEEDLGHGQLGRRVTIRIFLEQDGEYIPKAEYVTAVLPM